MVTYPITVGRSNYRGKNRQAKQIVAAENRHALNLEQQLNALLLQQQRPVETYSWEQIAERTGIALRWVEKFGPTIDGSSLGGLTAWKHGMTYEEAMAADA
jgi:predicted secreted protein